MRLRDVTLWTCHRELGKPTFLGVCRVQGGPGGRPARRVRRRARGLRLQCVQELWRLRQMYDLGVGKRLLPSLRAWWAPGTW